MEGKSVTVLDSTLRDGTQGRGVSFSVSDKLKIIKALDRQGIAYIEAGNPGSNPKDRELFDQVQGMSLAASRLVAFGSTRKKTSAAEEDEGLRSLVTAKTDWVSIFGKSSMFHVQTVLQATGSDNLAMIRDSVAYLAGWGKNVFFDAEHFFDGYKEDEEYAMATLRAAAEGGARMVVLCDTNGGSYITDIYRITEKVVKAFPDVEVGIHAHNDMGLAVINSMVAVEAGASHVQGTFLGIGERAGNANLSTLIPDLQLKRDIACVPQESMHLITKTARTVADAANKVISSNMPYVGSGAFAHKGGMHIDAVVKDSATFEHIAPEAVGNTRRLVASEVAGASTLMDRIHKYDPTLTKDSDKTRKVVERLKSLEYRGYQFEAADESLELVIRRVLGVDRQFFRLEHFKIIGEQPLIAREYPSTAMIKVSVGDSSEVTAAEGDGPVHALDLALRKALVRFYPSLESVSLSDFKVRVLESDATTAATVRVLIESTDGEHSWTTEGVSTDIIEASFLALSDSIEYKLTMDITDDVPMGHAGSGILDAEEV